MPQKKSQVQKRHKAAKYQWTDELESKLLNQLRLGCTIASVIESNPVSYKMVRDRRKNDPEFEARWEDARAMGDDAIRDEIHRRAIDGVLEPVYYEGEVVGRKRKYSDPLLMFYAKSRMPEFKENQHDHTHSVSTEGMAEQLASKLTAIASSISANADTEGDDG